MTFEEVEESIKKVYESPFIAESPLISDQSRPVHSKLIGTIPVEHYYQCEEGLGEKYEKPGSNDGEYLKREDLNNLFRIGINNFRAYLLGLQRKWDKTVVDDICGYPKLSTLVNDSNEEVVSLADNNFEEIDKEDPSSQDVEDKKWLELKPNYDVLDFYIWANGDRWNSGINGIDEYFTLPPPGENNSKTYKLLSFTIGGFNYATAAIQNSSEPGGFSFSKVLKSEARLYQYRGTFGTDGGPLAGYWGVEFAYGRRNNDKVCGVRYFISVYDDVLTNPDHENETITLYTHNFYSGYIAGLGSRTTFPSVPIGPGKYYLYIEFNHATVGDIAALTKKGSITGINQVETNYDVSIAEVGTRMNKVQS